MRKDERVFFKLEGMPDLLEVKFLVFENLPIQNFKTLNLPEALPNLKNLLIQKCDLTSFEGLLSKMPNLKSFSLGSLPKLHSLEGLPSEMPNLKSFSLGSLPKLHSLEGLPSKLPQCTKLEINDVNLLTLKNLPKSLHPRFYLDMFNRIPKDHVIFDLSQKIAGFAIDDYIIRDFDFLNNYTLEELKEADFTFCNCIIQSFEGFPKFPENTNFNEIFDRLDENFNTTYPSIFFLQKTKIRSLSGLSLRFLKYILPHYCLREKLFDFAPQGKKIFENCLSPEIVKEFKSTRNDDPEHISNTEEIQNYHRLLKKAFIPKNLPPLYEYFKKSTIVLAHQYIADPSGMPPTLIERLIHEADHNIRKILENSLPPKDPTILKISQKIAFNMPNGFKILK